MSVDSYDPATALDAYWPNRTTRAPARLWAIEKAVHDLAEIGIIAFFEGGGDDPTVLDDYGSTKIWLRTDAGITTSPAQVRKWNGTSPATAIANWPLMSADPLLPVEAAALDADLSAIAALSSTGLAARTASNTWAQRTITGTTAEITITNGDGVSGNPTASLPSAITLTGKTLTGGTFASPTAITGLPDPTNPQDAATRAYVDAVARGLDPKPSVTVATTANITLSGEQTIDGVLTSASRVLVKDQSSTAQNGIYVSAAGSWIRATDMDAWAEVPGAYTLVEQGSTQADYMYVCTSDTGGTLGSTAIAWSRIGGASTPTTTRGDMVRRGASVDERVALGTSGYAWMAGALDPAWTGFLQAGTGAVTRTWQDKAREIRSVLDFIPTALHANILAGTSTDDVATYLSAARDYIAGLTTPGTLQFPGGVYSYSTSPNWGINDVRIEALGEVRLRYTGTGNAVILDGGASGYVNNMFMGRFLVECTSSSADNGVYVRSVHHSDLGFNVRSTGTGMAGMRIEFAVCTIFRQFTCSNNEGGGFYSGLTPTYGVICTQRGAGEGTAACLFECPVIEGVQIGIQGGLMVGCTWSGGTSEGCTSTGIYLTSADAENIFVGIFCEVNTTYDLLLQGDHNTFYGCNFASTVSISSGAVRNSFFGGLVNQITCDSGTQNTVCRGLVYNRYGTGGLTDNGTSNSFEGCMNAATTTLGRPPSTSTPTVGATPYTYTNTTGDIQEVIVSGGTVSAIAYIRSGQSGFVVGYNSTGTSFTLRPNDGMQVAYTVAPTVKVLI